MSFDYRGMGESLPAGRSLRGFRADLFDWARDIDAAIDALLARHPDAPLFIVGHSLGAQLPGLLRHRDRIAGLVSVAAGSGYWRDNAPQLKRIVLYFWHVLVPLSVTVCRLLSGQAHRQGRRPAARRRHAVAPLVHAPALSRRRRRRSSARNSSLVRAFRWWRCRSPTTN